jgi:hypothetical protein
MKNLTLASIMGMEIPRDLISGPQLFTVENLEESPAALLIRRRNLHRISFKPMLAMSVRCDAANMQVHFCG